MIRHTSWALFSLTLLASFSLHAIDADSRQTGFAPTEMPGWTTYDALATVATQTLNVVEYVRAHLTHDTLADIEAKIPRYNRIDNFGTWTRSDEAGNCYDTRAQVLIRDADPTAKISFSAAGCSVTKGLWHEPYASTDYKLAKAVQIDHVVPLKHAYLTGASAWAPERRCYYANFLHNSFHLLAVSGHENMSKGDNGPQKYLPPTDSFQCEYVADWLKVKTIWDLVATDDEMNAIDTVIRTHHCSAAKYELDAVMIQNERSATQNVSQHCKDFESVGIVGD